ncbi:MAG TPA: hypothetical protein DCQ30_13250 [Acidimicrobiaceae bacterium]|nr:hypothetical protein [Acidimicrobiaceae bacterium]
MRRWSPRDGRRYGEAADMSRREETMADPDVVQREREQLVKVGKLAVGIVVGVIFGTVVGPIVLAVAIGLATGH